jgi:hypothetical protein
MKLASRNFSAVFEDGNEPQYVNGVYYRLPANSKPLKASVDVIVMFFTTSPFYPVKFNPDLSQCIYIKMNGAASVSDILGEDGYDTPFYNWLRSFAVKDYQNYMLPEFNSKQHLLPQENHSAA